MEDSQLLQCYIIQKQYNQINALFRLPTHQNDGNIFIRDNSDNRHIIISDNKIIFSQFYDQIVTYLDLYCL